ncbi:MAG: hypothetical protein M1821_007826, partial [Bathelium mastoideum]
MVLPLIPLLYIFTLPDSPRYLLQAAHRTPKNKATKRKRLFDEALKSLNRLNRTELQAAREMFRLYWVLENEPDGSWIQNLKSLFTHRRTARALFASEITMFLQQFCGVN